MRQQRSGFLLQEWFHKLILRSTSTVEGQFKVKHTEIASSSWLVKDRNSLEVKYFLEKGNE